MSYSVGLIISNVSLKRTHSYVHARLTEYHLRAAIDVKSIKYKARSLKRSYDPKINRYERGKNLFR